MNPPDTPAAPRRGPAPGLKLVVSLVVLVHLAALFSCVLAGGGPFAMKQVCVLFRPYLRFMWLDNAYRFYAPEPGPTEVLWYYLKYEDGSGRWYQVPRREDFTLRMPFQRYMSIALLASSLTDSQAIPLKDDPEARALALAQNRVKVKTVLDARGLIYFRSYARHIARTHATHPHTGARLLAMDVYRAIYYIRSPYQIRQNMDMYDPRLVGVIYYDTFDTAGNLVDEQGRVTDQQPGFSERIGDDFFVDFVQKDILPLLEENAKQPAGQRRTIAAVLTDYGIPYPLVQPILKLSPEEQEKFFALPHDRETLRDRYEKAVKRDDVTQDKPKQDPMLEQQKKEAVFPDKAHAESPRSVQ